MRENPLCTRREGKTLNKRRKREREAGREGGRERDVGYGTYQIDMFGSMALQNYKQQVAAVPYNERKITLCTLYHDRRKETQQPQ